ncbi:hypothetical protein KSP39_PZI010288 [Platanthera zijinensis]|uniref:Uncharacterized protein n=1 Tax=Platanthera zijinensis TaxID=2320716 RepID=A0AAP0BJT7_9ASPA
MTWFLCSYPVLIQVNRWRIDKPESLEASGQLYQLPWPPQGENAEACVGLDEDDLDVGKAAAALNPSTVDPVYRVHSSRVKLLYTHEKRNVNVLQVVTAYAFNQKANEKKSSILTIRKMFAPKNSNSNSKENRFSEILMDDRWHVLYDDSLYAPEIFVQVELKHFHKAS